MERLLTPVVVTVDARALILLANVTSQLKSIVVYLAAITTQLLVVSVKPNLIVPIDAGVMDPLFAVQIHYCPWNIIAQEAVWQQNLSILTDLLLDIGAIVEMTEQTLVCLCNQVLAASTVPGLVIVRNNLQQVPSVTGGMHHHIAQLTYGEWVILFDPLTWLNWETYVAHPILFILILVHHDLGKLASENQYRRWDLADFWTLTQSQFLSTTVAVVVAGLMA
jgi:hypothetical protein